jgi:hypothetical protein
MKTEYISPATKVKIASFSSRQEGDILGNARG